MECGRWTGRIDTLFRAAPTSGKLYADLPLRPSFNPEPAATAYAGAPRHWLRVKRRAFRGLREKID